MSAKCSALASHGDWRESGYPSASEARRAVLMSAIATARIHALGGETSHTVLRGVSLALTVNAAACVVAAVLLGAFLRPRGRKQATA